MKAIILVAGLGRRLKPLTDTIPKCLTEINGKAILVNALEHLESSGLEEAVLVVGHLKDKIKERIGGHFGRLTISYVENPLYQKTNTSYSLWLALARVPAEERVLILEGDVFFEKKLLEQFLRHAFPNATVVQRYTPGLTGSFVAVRNNRVVDWIHMSRRPSDFRVEDKFKTVNIHKFGPSFVRTHLLPVLKKHVGASHGREPLEYVMEDLVKNRRPVISAFPAQRLKWFEIDDVSDLKIAERIFAKPALDTVRSYHGGYWRYDLLDFHYLFNHYFPTPALYAELARRLPTLSNHYPSSQKTLAASLFRWKDQEYFRAENLVVGNGSSELIRLLNDHVITKAAVPLPTYNEFVRLPDEKLHTYVLREESRFVLDPDKLIAEARRSGSQFAVVINPSNPVGYLTPLADIEKILKAGVTLIVDEAFMVFAGAEYSAEQLVPAYKNLVVVTSCTKSLGIAGLRLGYLLSSNDEILQKMRQHVPIWNVNSLTEHLIEILPHYRQEHVASIARSRADTEWFFAALQKVPYLTPYPTFANAVFCQVRGSASRLGQQLYDQYNFLIKAGLNQRELRSDSYVRLGVRNRRDNERLLAALKELDPASLKAVSVGSRMKRAGRLAKRAASFSAARSPAA